jgi:outer membrane protein
MRLLQPYLAALCAALVAAPPAAYAQSPASPSSNGSWHSRFTSRYIPRLVEPINLGNSGRLEALLRAGRLYLSLQDAIALALENNLDIELQRYGPRLAETDVLRAQAGGVVRGVPTAISSGPASAANLQTGGAGGTGGGQTGGGGGGGVDTGGATVLFSGTQIPNLDEVLFVNYNWGHRTVAQANSFATGIPALVFSNNQLSMGVQKEWLTGTRLQMSYSQAIQASNNLRAEINPFTSGYMNMQFNQPLLRGFSYAVNSRNIRIAKNNVKVSDLVFREQVIATVAAVVNLYADLVSFNEDVKVRQQALSLAEKLYNDNKKQVEIGTLAPISIVQAEAEVARSQQELTNAETQVLQQETILKNALSKTGVMSPSLADARVVPTDRLSIPDVESIQPIQDLVSAAIERRPELAQTRFQIENAKISLEGSKNLLLPSLDLVASAQNNGLAGQMNALPLPDAVAGFQRTANPVFLGNLGSVWSQIFSRNYPDYSIGFQLTVPLRNRAAQADVVRDQLSLRQAELRQRQELNLIRVEVQNALIGLQQSRARFQAAQKSRILQEQNLDAEQKKYALGASTIFFVIQAQRDLAQAQAAEVGALTAYNRARVSLHRATGQILEVHNVSVDEAAKGSVSRPADPLPALNGNGNGNAR